MPYSHHHKTPNLPDPLRNAGVVRPHPDKPNHAYTVRIDSIQKPNGAFLARAVPMKDCCLHRLSDESLHSVINQLLAGEKVEWDQYQPEMDAANRYHEWSKRWGTVIKIDDAYWGWTGSGTRSSMGAIPIDPTEGWEITPEEEGLTLSDYGIYGFVNSDEQIEKLKAAIRSYY